MNEPAGRRRILQTAAAAADRLGQRRDGLVLADDALVQHALHAQQLLGLGLGEVGDRNARGHAHHVGDLLDADLLNGLLGRLLPVLLRLVALLLELGLLVAHRGGALEVLRRDGGVLLGARVTQLVVEVAQLLGQRHVADAHARARLVDDVDRLVGQVAVLDVATRQRHGGVQRLLGVAHLVMRLVLVAQALQDADRLLLGGLVDHDRLEAALERGVLLEVLAVLVDGGRADDLDLAAGQRRLQDGGGVDGALGRAGADQRVHLVDEQDDVLGVDHLFDDLLQALLELAAVLAAGDQGRHVERDQALAAQDVGYLVGHDELERGPPPRRSCPRRARR